MKKLFLLAAVAVFGLSNAQKSENSGATAKGKWVVEANTGSWTTGGNTSFGLTSIDGETAWNIGGEAGYFVADNLAVKGGLGYGKIGDAEGTFSYKLGAQYYITGKFPVGVDFTGASSDGESVNYVGLEGGYAWFVAPNIALTPKLRYNITLDDQKSPSAFQGLIGFSLFF